MMFQKGGNAVDAACAMLAATSHDVGHARLGRRDAGADLQPAARRRSSASTPSASRRPARRRSSTRARAMTYPPEYGPLAAVTPGTPGGLMMMLAEYGTLSLADVLAPAIEMADGYPIEAQLAEHDRAPEGAASRSGRTRRRSSCRTSAQTREAPEPGEIFRQPDLAATLRKLVEAEQQALEAGKSRKEAIYAAYDRFYKGDIAQEIVRGVAGAGRAASRSRTSRNWKVQHRGAGQDELQGHRRLQAHRLDAGPGDAAGAEHPRERRPEGDGLQQRALHPHALPGDEPGVRRPRLLLRRSRTSRPRSRCAGLLSKEYAQGARATDQLASATIRPSSRAIRIRSRARPIRSPTLLEQLDARPAPDTKPQRRSAQPTALDATFDATASAPARPRSRPRTRRAGSCRSRRAAAGCRR